MKDFIYSSLNSIPILPFHSLTQVLTCLSSKLKFKKEEEKEKEKEKKRKRKGKRKRKRKKERLL